MARRLILAAVAAVLVLAAVTIGLLGSGGGSHRPAGRAHPASAGSPIVGISVNRVFNDVAYSPVRIAALLRALAATGVTAARSDALWEAAEPAAPVAGQHRYDWSFDDEIAGALAGAGLPWLPILDYSAPWARADPALLHSPPADPAQFAAFAAALARRYGPGGAFWRSHPQLAQRPPAAYEVWNEPDAPLFWSPAPDPAAYARLYAAARSAIAAVDPATPVIVGGLTHPQTFLPALLGADPGLRAGFGGVAIHPYGDSTAAVLGNVRRARGTLSALDLGSVPLYVTEFGWVTSPAGARHYVAPAARPALIAATVAALAHTNCGVGAELLYTWVTPRRAPANPDDWFGIEPPGGGPSPDVSAFAAGVHAARSPAPTAQLC